MQSRLSHWLARHQTTWKTEWMQRLQREPVVSAMAEPAILGYLMHETMAQFAERLERARPPRAPRVAPVLTEAIADCRCGFNPLLAYFSTGAAALGDLIAADDSLDEASGRLIRARWIRLARHEIEALCGSCTRACDPGLRRQAAPVRAQAEMV